MRSSAATELNAAPMLPRAGMREKFRMTFKIAPSQRARALWRRFPQGVRH